jgi:hypothetical protein
VVQYSIAGVLLFIGVLLWLATVGFMRMQEKAA